MGKFKEQSLVVLVLESRFDTHSFLKFVKTLVILKYIRLMIKKTKKNLRYFTNDGCNPLSTVFVVKKINTSFFNVIV